MTINELNNKLIEIGVPQDSYSIMIGGLPNERLCIVKEEMWEVYYSERGKKRFEKEEEACEYFYEKMRVSIERLNSLMI